jgi:hypothetical protein
MKIIILSGIVFILSLSIVHAQETTSVKKESNRTVDSPNWFIGLGFNALDNGNSKIPFNTSEWAIKTPFSISLERNIQSRLSLALSFSTNELKVKSIEKFYFSMDLSGRYYFDDYIFKNKDIETYTGLGLGRFYLENNGNTTFNMSLGGRYWFLKNFALSLQGIAKAALNPVNKDVLSYYEYNFGIVWRNSLRKNVIKDTSIKTTIVLNEILSKEKEEVMALKESIIKAKQVVVSETVKDESVASLPLTDTKLVEALESKLSANSPAVEILTQLEFTGDWYISIREKEKKTLIFNYYLYSIYTNPEDEGTIWISDFKKGLWLQCKLIVNLADGTFIATKQRNEIDEGTVTITNGKIEKGTGVSKSRNKVDKIYFEAQFSYDPDNILIFEGHKSTGIEEDKY